MVVKVIRCQFVKCPFYISTLNRSFMDRCSCAIRSRWPLNGARGPPWIWHDWMVLIMIVKSMSPHICLLLQLPRLLMAQECAVPFNPPVLALRPPVFMDIRTSRRGIAFGGVRLIPQRQAPFNFLQHGKTIPVQCRMKRAASIVLQQPNELDNQTAVGNDS